MYWWQPYAIQNLVRVAAETQSDATYDGQLALSMLTARFELQNAGFGIAGPNTSHVITQTSGSSSTLYWRYKMGSQFYCKGLQDIAVGSNRELRLIDASTSACTETASLTSLTYTTSQTLGEFKILAALWSHLPYRRNPVGLTGLAKWRRITKW